MKITHKKTKTKIEMSLAERIVMAEIIDDITGTSDAPITEKMVLVNETTLNKLLKIIKNLGDFEAKDKAMESLMDSKEGKPKVKVNRKTVIPSIHE